uniref:Uncharacterized protein n=1 Tax=Rhodopseudomonas palustris (strain BisA53) TaxID=316055 RepID=Q07MR4_RHOP5
MCDYSLTGVASRPARVADKLVSVAFWQGSTTRGFASVDDPSVAVCLRPGTEVAFGDDVAVRGLFFRKTVRERLARFRKVDIDQPERHHDALEFANGTVVLLNDLVPGQHAVVLQLPADSAESGQASAAKVAGRRPVAETAAS